MSRKPVTRTVASPPSDFRHLLAEHGKSAWVSESWHQMGSWYGATGMVTKVMASFLQGNYTGWTAWGLLFGAYNNVLCQDKGLMYATSPWSGSYNIQPTIFATAHLTQFTKVGWKMLPQGAGSGAVGGGGGATVLTFAAPAPAADGTADFSLVIDAQQVRNNARSVGR